MKKFACFLMSLVMLFTALPANMVWAEEFEGETLEVGNTAEESFSKAEFRMFDIINIEIAPLEVADGSQGYSFTYDFDAQGERYYYWVYYPSSWRYQVTFTYSDGSSYVLYGTQDEIYEQTGCSLDIGEENTSYWNPGRELGPYEMKAFFMGFYTTIDFDAPVDPKPIVSIDVEPVVIVENTHGDRFHDTDADGVEHTWWYYYTEPQLMTITFADGTTITDYSSSIYYLTGKWVNYIQEFDQNWEHPLTPGVYKGIVEYCGKTAPYTVEIVESPVERIEIASVEITEGTNGSFSRVYDSDSNDYYTAWYYNVDLPQISVYFKDGHSITGSENEIYELTGEYISDGQYESQQQSSWGLGEHVCEARFMGASTTYTVTITETTVESIVVQPIEIIEGADGYIDTYMDGDGVEHTYWRYRDNPRQITVNYKDGNSITGTQEEIFNWTGTWVWYDPEAQNYENQWGLGSYELIAYYMGVQASYTVTIVETPVESIEIAPMEIIEGTQGYPSSGYDEEGIEHTYWYYDPWPWDKQITVNYKDGHSFTGTRDELYSLTGELVEVNYYQNWDDPWGIGDHEGTVSYMGITVPYLVTITETPVDNIFVEPVVIEEGTNGWLAYNIDENGEEHTYWHYIINDHSVDNLQLFTINYKDGHSITGTRNDIYEQTGYWVLLSFERGQSWDNPLEVGTYEVKASFMGYETTYTVTIVENPKLITSIEIAPIVVEEGGSGYLSSDTVIDGVTQYYWRYQIDEAIITIHYKDGSSFIGKPYEISNEIGIWPMVEIDAPQSADNPLTPGTYSTTVFINGMTGHGTYTIVESPVESLSFDEPVRMIEEADGRWSNDYTSGENYYHYDNRIPQFVTIRYKDGTENRYKTEELYQLTGSSCTIVDEQSVDHPYHLGENTAHVYYKGVMASYIVIVEETPVDYLVIEPVSIIEGAGYGWQPARVSVYFKDGTSLIGKTPDELAAATGYRIGGYYNFEPVQGDNTATLTFMGKTAEYTVRYLETPIERMEIDPWTVPETALPALWQNVDRLTGTIYMKDGTVFSGRIEDFCYQYGLWSFYEPGGWGTTTPLCSMQNEGELVAQIHLLGCTADVQLIVEPDFVSFEVIEDPIIVVNASAYPGSGVKYKVYFANGEMQDRQGLIISSAYDTSTVGDYEVVVRTYPFTGCDTTATCTLHVIDDPVEEIVFEGVQATGTIWGVIHYKDGTTQRVDFSKREFIYKNIQYPTYYNTITEDDQTYYLIRVFGKDYRCPVVKTEKQYRSAAASMEDELILTLEKLDGSFEVYTILGYDSADKRLLTDKGYIYNVVIDYRIGDMHTTRVNDELIFLTENISCKLPDNVSVESMLLWPYLYEEAIKRFLPGGMPECYDGVVTADNLDYLVGFAVTAHYLRTYEENPQYTTVLCTTEEAIRYVKAYWGIELTDLSGCHLINPVTGLVNCAVQVGAFGMDMAEYMNIFEDQGMLKHICRDERYTSILIAPNGQILSIRRGLAVGDVIATLADGQEWYLVDGMIQKDYSGSLVIDTKEYQISEGRVVSEGEKEEEIEEVIGGTDRNGINWSLKSNGALWISGQGAMQNYSSTANVPWYEYREEITSIIIEEGITSIGKYSFGFLSKVESVIIPESVIAIGDSAFYYCGGLGDSLILPKGITSIGEEAFYNCKLKEVFLGEVPCTIKKRAFGENDQNLKVFCNDLETWMQMTLIENPFSSGMSNYRTVLYVDGEELVNLLIPEGTEVIGDYQFSICPSIESISIPDTVTSIGISAFQGCSKITEIVVPETVTTINEKAFASCINLESLTVPFIGKVKSSALEQTDHVLGYWFNTSYETGLVSCKQNYRINNYNGHYSAMSVTFYIPESLKSIRVTNQKTLPLGAFNGCSMLEEIYLPDVMTSVSASNYSEAPLSAGTNAVFYVNCTNEQLIKSVQRSIFSCKYELIHGELIVQGAHEATFFEEGYTGDTVCQLCESILVEGEVIPRLERRMVQIEGCSLTLSGDIGLNFYLNLDTGLAANGGYAVFEQNGIVSAPILLSAVLHQGEQYKLTYHVAAKEMDDTIILKLYDGEGNLVTLYKGEDVYENGYSYSVNTYVELALNSDSVSVELKELMQAMREYGNCAQSYFGVSDDIVSNVTVDPAVFEAYTFSSITNSSKVSYYGSSLLLKDLTTIRYYFKITDGMENYSVTINGAVATLVQKGDLCYIEIADIAAQDLEEMPVVIVSDQNGQEVYRLVYGAFSYADVVMNQSQNMQLKTLMSALYMYYLKAEVYFTK